MPIAKKKAGATLQAARPGPRTAKAKMPEKPEVFSLRLFVAGHTPKSERAFANLTALCEKHLKGRYQVEVIDLLENPHLARGNASLHEAPGEGCLARTRRADELDDHRGRAVAPSDGASSRYTASVAARMIGKVKRAAM